MSRQSVGFVSIGRSIFPVIKSADDSQIERAERRNNPLIMNELLEGIVICYVRETLENLELVTEAHLQPYLMNREDIAKSAKRNLAERVRDSAKIRTVNPENPSPEAKPFYRGILDKKFDTSLMVVDEFWERVEEMLQSNAVAVCIPARNALYFADANIPESVETMRLAAGESYHAGMQDELHLTQNMYVRENGEWSLLSK